MRFMLSCISVFLLPTLIQGRLLVTSTIDPLNAANNADPSYTTDLADPTYPAEPGTPTMDPIYPVDEADYTSPPYYDAADYSYPLYPNDAADYTYPPYPDDTADYTYPPYPVNAPYYTYPPNPTDALDYTYPPNPVDAADPSIPADAPIPAFIVSLRKKEGVSTLPTYINSIVRTHADPKDEYTYDLSKGIDPKSWFENLNCTVGSGRVLIFIHGFDNDAPAAVTRYLHVQKGMAGVGSGITVVCFDWASSANGKYWEDHRLAVESGSYLLQIIKDMNRSRIPSNKINILTHSMGGYVVQNAFASLLQGSEYNVANVMMAEADVLRLSFEDDSFVAAGNNLRLSNPTPTSVLSCVMPFVTNLTVYWSTYDVALKDAPLLPSAWTSCWVDGKPNPSNPPLYPLSGRQRLGFKGLTAATLSSKYKEKLHDVEYSNYYFEKYCKNDFCSATDSHVWPLLGTKNHNMTAGDKAFMTDVYQVVTQATHFTSREASESNSYQFKPPSTMSLN